MLTRFPTQRQTPSLAMLLEDIGNPPARAIARALHVSERTVFRWLRDDEAPRPVLLALFYLTRWGHSWVHTQAHNDAVLYAGLASCREREIAELKRKAAHLGSIGEFGSANDPAPDIRAAVPPPKLDATRVSPREHTSETAVPPKKTARMSRGN